MSTRKGMKRILSVMTSVALIVFMLAGLVTPAMAAGYTAGSYEGTANGRNDVITVSVTIEKAGSSDYITDVSVVSHRETERYWNYIGNDFWMELLGTADVERINGIDTVTRATISSRAVKEAVIDALQKAEDSGSVTEPTTEAFASGNGSEQDPYIISSEAQLRLFAQSVNAGNNYNGAFVQLSQDIALSDEAWVPIGSSQDAAFAGTFDGAGHRVSHVRIGAEDARADINYAGFFGVVDGAGVLKNLHLSDVKIYSTYTEGRQRPWAGGLAGRSGALVDGCSVTNGLVDVSGSDRTYAGGLVGSQTGTISNSWTDINVVAAASNQASYAGGLAAMGGNSAFIINSATYGDVTASGDTGSYSSSYAGGLVGMAVGNVYNSASFGDITLNNSTASDEPCIGTLIGYHANGAASDLYYSNQASLTLDGAAMSEKLAIGNESSRYASPSRNITAVDSVEAAREALTNGLSANALADAKAWFAEQNSGLTDEELAQELKSWENQSGVTTPSGDATEAEEDLTKIKTVEQLVALSESVANGEQYLDQTITLEADLDLSGIDWMPIGSSTRLYFGGTFDGKGHTITGLTIGSDDNAASLDYAGLFGKMAKTTVVKNLNLENVSINADGGSKRTYVGALAGDSNGGIVENCSVNGGSVKAGSSMYAYAGGLLGKAKGTVANSTADVDAVADTLDADGSAVAGGLIGITFNGTLVENVAAFGDVSAIGSNDNEQISNIAGGLIGQAAGYMYNGYASGNVNVTNKIAATTPCVGSVIGELPFNGNAKRLTGNSDATLTANGQTMSKDTAIGNNDGVSEDVTTMPVSEMTTQVFADQMSKGTTEANRMAAANWIASQNQPVDYATLSQSVELWQGWNLRDGKVLLSGEEYIEVIDEIPFANGSGTKEDPYLITNKQELQDFAASVTNGKAYTGQYIKVTNDIDISGENWQPIGGSVNRFDGDFDGAGHTISGLTMGSESAPMELDASNTYVGLFGWINEHAVIHNVNLTDVSIHTHSTGSVYMGGIAGRANGTETEGDYSGAIVDNCAISGQMTHTTDRGTSFMGGVIGYMFKGAVINTMTDVNISGAEKSGELIEIGGIVGIVNRGLIANDYALGDLAGSAYRDAARDIEGMTCVGNIAGVNGGYIANCYGEGNVKAEEYSIDTGVLVGWVTGIGRVYNCWYNEKAEVSIDGRIVSPVDPFGEVVGAGVSDEWGYSFAGSLVAENKGYEPGNEGAQKVADGLNASFSQFPVDIQNLFGLSADALQQWKVDGTHAVFGDAKATVTYQQPEIEKQQQDYERDTEPKYGTWYGRSTDKSTVVQIDVKNGKVQDVKVLSGNDDTSSEAYKNAVSRAEFKATYGDTTDYSAADTSKFDGGTGTAEDPYLISSEAQLRYIAEAINEDVDWHGVHFKQTKDITVKSDQWKPIGWGIFADADGDGFGQDVVALYPFKGQYDGGDFAIRGLRAGSKSNPVDANYMGLFGIVQGEYTSNEIPTDGYQMKLTNIHVEDAEFYIETKWRTYVGGLVGNAQGGFVIDNCSVNGVTNARSQEDFGIGGGLSGSLLYGLVSNTSTDVDVTTWSGKNYSYAGGMSAMTNRATIINSYTLGDVHADADLTNHAEAGGFIGLDGGTVINCYAKGNVEILNKYSMYIGGFVGMAANTSEHRLCYYNTDANQIVAGEPVSEKRYAGKFVNQSAEADTQAQSGSMMSSQAFADLLNSNRTNIDATLAEVRQTMDADENGSSRYHSIYFNGNADDLTQWTQQNQTVVLSGEEPAAEVQSIEINSTNHKTAYRVGNALDVKNMTIAATMSDGSVQTVAVTEDMISGFDTTTAGSKTVTVTYEGQTTTFDINVTAGSSGGGGGGGGVVISNDINVEAPENGTLSVDKEKASKGATVTLTPEAEEGYALDQLVVTDADGNQIALTEKDGRYSFTMPDSEINVKATFKADDADDGNPFVDVKASEYFFDSVMWAVDANITAGTDTTHFSPDKSCTRAEAVTFLWRANGSPISEASNPFEDVSEDAYYYNAVLWAVENGITVGTSEATFSPDIICSRAHIVTFLFRFADAEKVDTSSAFTDVAADAYYVDAVNWAVDQHVTVGTSATTFSPDNDCTRGQIVTMLARYMVE